MRKLMAARWMCVFLLTVLVGCRNSDRDIIQFHDATQSVENSIQELNDLMDSLVAEKVTNYYFDHEGFFYVNSIKLFLLNEGTSIPTIDTSIVFAKLKSNEVEKFISNVLFLKKNFITSAYKSLVYGIYMYDYRATEENRYEDIRQIIFTKTTFKLPVSQVEKVNLLDQKGNLYLVSHTDIRDE